MNGLRKLIRKLIKEIYQESSSSKSDPDLLVEPDDPGDDEENEASVVASIAGAMVPSGSPRGVSKKKKRLPKGWQKVK